MHLRILALFASDPPLVSIYPADAERLLPGVTRGAMYRACADLHAAGWLEQIDGAKETCYRLGPTAYRVLACAFEGGAHQLDLMTRVIDESRRTIDKVLGEMSMLAYPGKHKGGDQ